jgi:hypothetical protein
MDLKILLEQLEQMSQIFSETTETPVAEEVEESKDDQTDMAAEIVANALAVALSQVEQHGVEFESAKEATDFAAKIMKSLIGRNKSMLMKRLAKFERQGADRTIKVAKRAM